MTYRCGIGHGMQAVGLKPRDPSITCDGCGLVRGVEKPGGMPYAWFIDGRAAPGWRLTRIGDLRRDECPRCKDKERVRP